MITITWPNLEKWSLSSSLFILLARFLTITLEDSLEDIYSFKVLIDLHRILRSKIYTCIDIKVNLTRGFTGLIFKTRPLGGAIIAFEAAWVVNFLFPPTLLLLLLLLA